MELEWEKIIESEESFEECETTIQILIWHLH